MSFDLSHEVVYCVKGIVSFIETDIVPMLPMTDYVSCYKYVQTKAVELSWGPLLKAHRFRNNPTAGRKSLLRYKETLMQKQEAPEHFESEEQNSISIDRALAC